MTNFLKSPRIGRYVILPRSFSYLKNRADFKTTSSRLGLLDGECRHQASWQIQQQSDALFVVDTTGDAALKGDEKKGTYKSCWKLLAEKARTNKIADAELLGIYKGRLVYTADHYLEAHGQDVAQFRTELLTWRDLCESIFKNSGLESRLICSSRRWAFPWHRSRNRCSKHAYRQTSHRREREDQYWAHRCQ